MSKLQFFLQAWTFHWIFNQILFLFSAGWEKEVHEIWGAFIDRQEAIKRIVERDGKTEEQAEARLSNQMSNRELISKCNTIFYTKWDYSITHQQVAKAWSRLNQIL